MRTHYDNLKVTQNADPEVIRAAYKALANKWHPDKATQDKKAIANRYMKIINSAFEVLSDSERRNEYDAFLQREKGAQNDYSHTAAEKPQQKDYTCTSCLDKAKEAAEDDEYFSAKGIAVAFFSILFLLAGYLVTGWFAWNGDKLSIAVLLGTGLLFAVVAPAYSFIMLAKQRKSKSNTKKTGVMATKL